MAAGRSALEKGLIGPAGEHFVLYQLYRRGMLAAAAPPRTPIVDLLVLSPDGETIAATLQVKTRSMPTRHPGWMMNHKHEDLAAERMFYAFVDLAQEPPATWVIRQRRLPRWFVRRMPRGWRGRGEDDAPRCGGEVISGWA